MHPLGTATTWDGYACAQERSVHPALVSTEESMPAELVSEVLNGSYQRRVPGTGDMRHGSEGWHALETSCKVTLCLCKGVPVQRSAVNFNRDTFLAEKCNLWWPIAKSQRRPGICLQRHIFVCHWVLHDTSETQPHHAWAACTASHVCICRVAHTPLWSSACFHAIPAVHCLHSRSHIILCT